MEGAERSADDEEAEEESGVPVPLLLLPRRLLGSVVAAERCADGGKFRAAALCWCECGTGRPGGSDGAEVDARESAVAKENRLAVKDDTILAGGRPRDARADLSDMTLRSSARTASKSAPKSHCAKIFSTSTTARDARTSIDVKSALDRER